MQNHSDRLKSLLEHTLPWIVLIILLLYTYAKFFEHPYLGYKTDSNGVVFEIYKNNDAAPLMLNDRILKIGPNSWDELKADFWKPLYGDLQTGQVVPLLIQRDSWELDIAWKAPGPNTGEIQDLIFNEGWLTYFFWLFGTLTLYNLRPKDARWVSMTLFNYLTAIWIVAGSGNSFYHIWGSDILLRVGIWLCMPAYLQLHWVFPKSLNKLPHWIVWCGYGLATLLAVLECFQVLPKSGYLFAFLLGVGGSLVLLILHGIFQTETRRDLRLLFFFAVLALLPAITFGFISAFISMPVTASGAILGLPLIPLAYFFAAYRRQLGDLEIRVNRIISIVIFLVLLMTGLAIVTTLVDRFVFPRITLLTDMVIVFVSALAAIWGLPYFQLWVERNLLGIPQIAGHLRDVFPTQITMTNSLPGLSDLLKNEIWPSLLVRQFVFLKIGNGQAETLFAENVPDEEIPDFEALDQLIKLSGKYLPLYPLTQNQSYSWIRLVLPLKIEENIIGLWLFGRRDPDDYYSQAEIQTLRVLADQAAIALSNILQTSRLKALFQADVSRYETDRLRLALDLHDSILNQLAVLMMKLSDESVTPDFQAGYDQLTGRLREIVSDLRPPMLNYGLKPAIEDYGDSLKDKSNHTIDVHVNIQESPDVEIYPSGIEQHIYRIVQEACENVLKHAKAKNLWITGKVSCDEIIVVLKDDGIGFDATNKIDLDGLLLNKHFGLAGMVERAELIDAQVNITSLLHQGTTIQITWVGK